MWMALTLLRTSPYRTRGVRSTRLQVTVQTLQAVRTCTGVGHDVIPHDLVIHVFAQVGPPGQIDLGASTHSLWVLAGVDCLRFAADTRP